MKLKRCNLVYLTILSAVAVALCTLPSGGQELNFTAPVEPPVPGSPPAAPFGAGPVVVATPALPAAVPPPGAPGGLTLFVENPHLEGVDEQTRKLHADDQAHERATRQLLEQLRNAESAGDRSPLLEKLSQTVKEHFEIRQQIRAKELEALEARVKKLRDLHEKREDNKAEIVKDRVDQLVRDAEGLGWSGGSDHAIFEPGDLLLPPTQNQPGAISIRSR